jgi:tRNA(fMet)-specific endonuclease VapC
MKSSRQLSPTKSRRAAGWLTRLAQEIEAYRKLERHMGIYRLTQVLGFDERAGAEFKRLRAARLRIGAMDLKIAAIALTHDAMVLTRNLKDFSRVPGLYVEDWTA